MLTMGTIFFARSISFTETFDNPTCRIFPASCAFFSAPTDSSIGTFAIDSVQLIDIDPFELQPLQTFVHALRQIFRPTIRHPLTRARSSETPLGRNHQIFWVWMQR